MATTAKVYLSDGLPIEVPNAHRLIYFPDGSAHILDKQDRPVFIGSPGRFVCVVMGYAENEEPDPKQSIPAPVVKRPVPGPVVPVVPVQPRPEAVTEQTQPMTKFPPVQTMEPPQHPQPGEVRITSLHERGPDGETTQEVNIPITEVPHRDFPRAPQTAGRP